jgi:DNA-binding CsgD family transcriptional regulator
VHAVVARPGMIIIDASLRVVACNGEALRILTYPDPPERIRQLDTWLAHRIRADLAVKHSATGFVEEFRSANRTYNCRSFPLDLRNQTGTGNSNVNGNGNGNGYGYGSSGGLHIVMLERRSNDAAKIEEISERFGLTAREKETIQYLVQGLTSKEIAQRMKISPNTVKAFLRLVMVKMDVSTRSGIIGRIVGPSA